MMKKYKIQHLNILCTIGAIETSIFNLKKNITNKKDIDYIKSLSDKMLKEISNTNLYKEKEFKELIKTLNKTLINKHFLLTKFQKLNSKLLTNYTEYTTYNVSKNKDVLMLKK